MLFTKHRGYSYSTAYLEFSFLKSYPYRNYQDKRIGNGKNKYIVWLCECLSQYNSNKKINKLMTR